MYISIRKQQGGGADISSFAGGKGLGSEVNFREKHAKPKIKIQPKSLQEAIMLTK
jgi:hypothetical protein